MHAAASTSGLNKAEVRREETVIAKLSIVIIINMFNQQIWVKCPHTFGHIEQLGSSQFAHKGGAEAGQERSSQVT